MSSNNNNNVHCYVGIAQKPTIVTHSAVGHFTDTNHINLVVAKCSQLEVYTLTNKGLKLLVDTPLYGRVSALQTFKPEGSSQELLFALLERCQVCILEWDTDHLRFKPRDTKEYFQDIERPLHFEQVAHIDSSSKLLCAHFSKNKIQVIPLGPDGSLQDPFTIGVNLESILDIKVIRNPETNKFLLGVLSHKSYPGGDFLLLFEIDMENKQHNEIKNVQLPPGYTTILSTLVSKEGSPYFVAFGNSGIHCISSTAEIHTSPFNIDRGTIQVASKLWKEEHSHLIGDNLAGLYYVAVKELHGLGCELAVTKLEIPDISVASTISFLNLETVYIGSNHGDSMILQLDKDDFTTPLDSPTKSKITERFTNIGPIVDFALAEDDENPKVPRLVTCSGAGPNSTLRILQQGFEIVTQDIVPKMEGIVGLWALKDSNKAAYHRYIVVSFTHGTRVLHINLNNLLEDVELSGIEKYAMTILSQNVAYDQLVQVTESKVRLIHAGTGVLLTEWSPADDVIATAAISQDKVVLGLEDTKVKVLPVGKGEFTLPYREYDLVGDISCIAISPDQKYVAVGMWGDNSVFLLDLTNLTKIWSSPQDFFKDTPQSMLFSDGIEGEFLQILLGNGDLYSVGIETTSGNVNWDLAKLLAQVERPKTLSKLSYKDEECILVESTPPVVLFQKLQRRRNLARLDTMHICDFRTASIPDCVFYSTSDSLVVGSVSRDREKLSVVKTVYMKEDHINRIAYQKETDTFMVCAISVGTNAKGQVVNKNYVRLLDGNLNVLGSHELEDREYGTCIVSMTFAGPGRKMGPLYCVGTGYSSKERSDPMAGRILLFSTFKPQDPNESMRISYVNAHAFMDGSVYAVAEDRGLLVAAHNETVKAYRFSYKNLTLRHVSSFTGRVLTLDIDSYDDTVLISDLSNSIATFRIGSQEGVRQREYYEEAHERAKRSMTCANVIDKETFIGYENEGMSFFLAKKHGQSAAPSSSSQTPAEGMQEQGRYHLGDIANKLKRGYMCPTKEYEVLKEEFPFQSMFCTPAGSVGVVVTVRDTAYTQLKAVERAMEDDEYLLGVASELGHGHWHWRSLVGASHHLEASKNFLDGNFLQCFLQLPSHEQHRIAEKAHTDVAFVHECLEKLGRLH